ncbi:MAG: DUF418 domain-containing protein [Pseudomonadota bacterium]|nr:DUF418 domain-containing protein [Pseudomonadota bacterium]
MATLPASVSNPRIQTLDIVRGVAVMGILAMNIVAFAMPFQAYMNPLATGAVSQADFVSWLFSFIFVDGKMRGLFSFLFGASMLLVIEKAGGSGQSPASLHFRRMVWLLVFGLIHLYLIWFGDILVGYALIGMVAWLFRKLSPRALICWGIGLLVVQLLVFSGLAFATFELSQAAAAPGADPAMVREWQAMQRQFGALTPQALAEQVRIYGQGGYGAVLSDRLAHHATAPIKGVLLFGWETLGYFLFGMAALKTGFLTGGWSRRAYRKSVLIGFGIGIPAYGLLAWVVAREAFSVPMVFGIVMGATVPFRPLMVVAVAALIILLTQQGGALVERIAATGRAAFTNYLGTSLIMTTLFYGYGFSLFGTMGRAELWIVVVAMWAVMLAWSKPWLDRFQYGPLEWLWRSLARGKVQPLRKMPPAEHVPAGA